MAANVTPECMTDNQSPATPGTARLTLTDALGRDVVEQSLPVSAGSNDLTPALPTSLAAGTYTLSVTGSFTGSVSTTERSLSGMAGPGTYTFAVVSTNPCGARGRCGF